MKKESKRLEIGHVEYTYFVHFSCSDSWKPNKDPRFFILESTNYYDGIINLFGLLMGFLGSD